MQKENVKLLVIVFGLVIAVLNVPFTENPTNIFIIGFGLGLALTQMLSLILDL